MTFYSGQTERWAQFIVNIFRQERNYFLRRIGKPEILTVAKKTTDFAPKVAAELLKQEADIEAYVRAQYLVGSDKEWSAGEKLIHLPWFTHLLTSESADKYRRFQLERSEMVAVRESSDASIFETALDWALNCPQLDARSQTAYAVHECKRTISPLGYVRLNVKYGFAFYDDAKLKDAAFQYVRFEREYRQASGREQWPGELWRHVDQLKEEIYGCSQGSAGAPGADRNPAIGSHVGRGAS